jgi:hypothetical protein
MTFFAIFVRPMRGTLLTIATLFWATTLCAQQPLKPRIDMPYAVSQLRNQRLESRKGNGQTINGYRLFMGLSNSRSEAIALQQEINLALAGSYVAEVVYDEPNFKLYIGRFYSQAEANRALYSIRPYYPACRSIRLPLPVPNSAP